MNKLLVIKLGGAVVTYKDSSYPKARIDVIKKLAKEIKQVSNQGYQLILVHGAGSFAHGLVKKYDLHHGMKTEKQKRAYDKVIASMMKLNGIIMAELTKLALPVITLPPHTFTNQTAGELIEFKTDLITDYLNNNQIPVLFGDMVLDDKWGCSVLSGDTIVCFLGKKLKAEKIIFLTDVDGIYDSDPKKNAQAKLIPEINNKNLAQTLRGLSLTGRADVTGEVRGKILQIKSAKLHVPVLIANGLKATRLGLSVFDDNTGTRLLFH